MYAAREGRAGDTKSPWTRLVINARLRLSLGGIRCASTRSGPGQSQKGRRRIAPTALLGVALVMSPFAHAGAQERSFSLDGLIVTAAPTARSTDAIASHVTILSGDDLRSLGFRSLADALLGVPGVDVVRGGSFGAVTSVFLRGGESDFTLVLVDGVQVNQAGGGFDFAGLTTDNVERVEIVRGPGSALYGSDAVSGVIHVITRTGQGPTGATISYQGGTFGRRDWAADLLAGTERAGYSLSVARRSTDGVFAFNNDHVNTVVSGKARFLPDEATEVSLSLRVTDREYHFPTDGAGAVVDRNAFTFSDETVAQLSVDRSIGEVFSVEALLGLNEIDGGTDDAPDDAADDVGFFGFASLDHFRRVSAEVRGHVRLDGAVVTGGVEIEEQRQRSFTESLSEFGVSAGRSQNERRNRGYFAHVTGTASRLSYNGGVRLEDNQRFGRIVSWQAGMAIEAPGTSGTLLRASIGRGIKEPTFFETSATGFAVGNPGLDPERSLGWEVGAERELFSGALTADVTWFDQAFEDLIQYTFAPPTVGDPNFFNVAAASSRGLEVGLTGRVKTLRGGLSWSWSDTEVTDSGFDTGEGATFVEGESLLRRPRHTVSLRAGLALNRIDLSASLTAVGERADRDFSTFPASAVTLEAYGLLTLGAQWQVSGGGQGRPGLALQLRAENLLDEVYDEVFGFPAAGRGLYVGARVSLGGRP